VEKTLLAILFNAGNLVNPVFEKSQIAESAAKHCRERRFIALKQCEHERFILTPHQYICGHEYKEHYGDHAIHGEKRRVQFAEIVSRD
jgi:hypothetical protein